MEKDHRWLVPGIVMLGLIATDAAAAISRPILSPGDPIIAVDLDLDRSRSAYPSHESPTRALDGNPHFKYLNFAGPGSGLIVTPAGLTTVRALQITTAGDFVLRDPASFELHGTNQPINSLDNGPGLAEAWTLIDWGTLALPDDRLTAGPIVPITNNTAYTSYRLTFPTLKDTAQIAMQIADLAFYADPTGAGGNLLSVNDPVIAIHHGPDSYYPSTEAPANAIDGDPDTKYLNFGKRNSGFIVTPSAGPTLVDSFQITTANDEPNRDPMTWKLYGTNDPIHSNDNSRALDETWTLIDSGDTLLPESRRTPGPLTTIDNDTFYTSYLFVVTSLKNDDFANSMHFADIQFFGIPEPTTLLLLTAATPLLTTRRNRPDAKCFS